MKKILFSAGIIAILLQAIYFIGFLRYVISCPTCTVGIFYYSFSILSFLIWLTSIFLLIKSLKYFTYKIYLTLLIINVINFFLTWKTGSLNILGASVIVLISILGMMNAEKNEKMSVKNKEQKLYAKYIVPIIATIITFPLNYILNKIINPPEFGFLAILFLVTLSMLILTPIIVYWIDKRKVTNSEIKNLAGKNAGWSLLITVILLIIEYLILSFLDNLNIIEFGDLIGG